MWLTYYDETTVAHVVPIGDVLFHILSDRCNCHPVLLYPDSIFRHNSYDKREYFETPPRKKEVIN